MSTVTQLRPEKLRNRVSEAEWTQRVDLAAAYRLTEHYGMSELIYTHLSARVPDEPDKFLIIAHGMLFSEVTASSLLKVDLEGKVAYQPEGPYGLQAAGFVIHSALYRKRPDVMAAMHTHTPAGVAVAALKCGLLPLSQTAVRFHGRIAYHDFNGPERDPAERDNLAGHLGDKNIMILRNHGLLTVGPTVAETFNAMFLMERACQAQLQAMACNTELNLMPPEVIAKAAAMYDPSVIRRYGLLEWPALLRLMDKKDPSFRD